MKKSLLITFGLVMVLALGGPLLMAAPPPPDGGEVLLSAQNSGDWVSLQPDDLLVIRLVSKPSTGYVWHVVAVNGAVLTQVGEEIETLVQGEDTIGAPVYQVLRFAGASAGATPLKLELRRPWERDSLNTYSVEVQVEGAYRGAYRAATLAQPVLGETAAPGAPVSYNYCNEIGGCTVVKNQGSCGSCWAFAAVGVYEQLIKGNDGVTRDLSEQYVVSCNYDGWGCGGGWCPFKYFVNAVPSGEPNAKAVYEVDFPYKAQDVACNPPHTHHDEIAQNWYEIGSSPSVSAIKQAILDYGPLWVGVCADSAMSNYGGGIFDTTTCTSLNHAVVLYGWDDNQGRNGVWYMRNSWGTSWGENGGNMRIGYGVNGIGAKATWLRYDGIGPQPPNPPSNLVATAVQPDINLDWQDNSSDEDGFRVQRKVDGGPYSLLTTVGANVTSYSDTGLAAGTYCYQVRAYKGILYSAWSNEACATIESGDVVFSDDFETNKGWSSAGGTATTGQWERANPEGTTYSGVTYQLGTTPSGSYGLVTGGSAGSSVGSYDIDGGDTRFRSPSIFLPGSGDITLSFNYYLSHYSNASSDDYLRVKVVGNTTQTVLEVLGSGTIKGAAWQAFSGSLNSFAGQTVYLQIEAADGGSGSLVEAAVDDVLIIGTESPEPPVAPSNLAATAISESQVDLVWQDNSDDEDGFEVQRKTGSGAFATVATVGADVTAYSDTGLAAETAYTYRVRATKGGLNSTWSNEASATTLPPTPPAAPTNLVATAASSSGINLTWADNSNDEDSFEIQRKTGAGTFSTVATVGANVVSYSDTGLTPGTTYTYRVRATKGSLSSGWSNEDSATTLTGPVFEDDFETDKGWNSAGGTATTGAWERANPEGTTYSGVTYQLGTTTSGSYDLVTEGSAGSSVGSYDIDGGDTRFRSPDITLPNQSGLTLSFQYYLAHYSNATSADYLRVKVVGATTQTVLEVLGTATIRGGAWQSASVNLDAFAGQTVYLLVEAADGGSGSLVEAGLDDVVIE